MKCSKVATVHIKSPVKPAVPIEIKESHLYLIQVTEMNLLHLKFIV